MADGKGPMGVTLLRTNAELDGNLEGHFPGHDFLVARGSCPEGSIGPAGDLGFHSGNMLLVRCACLKTTCMCFVPLTFSFAGPNGYPLGGLGGLPSAGLSGLTAAARLLGNVRNDDGRISSSTAPSWA